MIDNKVGCLNHHRIQIKKTQRPQNWRRLRDNKRQLKDSETTPDKIEEDRNKKKQILKEFKYIKKSAKCLKETYELDRPGRCNAVYNFSNPLRHN